MKQIFVTLRSSKTRFVALAKCCQRLQWIYFVMSIVKPTRIHEGNQSCIKQLDSNKANNRLEVPLHPSDVSKEYNLGAVLPSRQYGCRHANNTVDKPEINAIATRRSCYSVEEGDATLIYSLYIVLTWNKRYVLVFLPLAKQVNDAVCNGMVLNTGWSPFSIKPIGINTILYNAIWHYDLS